MAEMTAAEVKELFKSPSFDGTVSNQEAEGIWRLIQQQAATIEAQTEAVLQESAMRQQAEAQCAAMQTAISRYVMGNIELLDELKAALEERK